jgi:hypothetical protein
VFETITLRAEALQSRWIKGRGVGDRKQLTKAPTKVQQRHFTLPFWFYVDGLSTATGFAGGSAEITLAVPVAIARKRNSWDAV